MSNTFTEEDFEIMKQAIVDYDSDDGSDYQRAVDLLLKYTQYEVGRVLNGQPVLEGIEKARYNLIIRMNAFQKDKTDDEFFALLIGCVTKNLESTWAGG